MKMADEHDIFLSAGAKMADLEGISWGPSAMFAPLQTVFLIPGYGVSASSATPGVDASTSIFGNFTEGADGTISGTAIQIDAFWDTGSLTADYSNTPLTV